MTSQINSQPANGGPQEDIELLLPWYVNGTLDTSDVAKVEAYLEQHPEMQVQLATLREDMDEAITANEAIRGPNNAALDRLMDQIEAETPLRHRAAKVKRGVMDAIDDFLRSLSPGRLGWAAMAAAAVIMLQAGVVGTMMLNPPSGDSTYTTASGGQPATGSFALIQFRQTVAIEEISTFLNEQGAEIVGGPKPGGLYRVRVSAEKLSDEARQALLAKLRNNEKLISTVLPSQ